MLNMLIVTIYDYVHGLKTRLSKARLEAVRLNVCTVRVLSTSIYEMRGIYRYIEVSKALHSMFQCYKTILSKLSCVLIARPTETTEYFDGVTECLVVQLVILLGTVLTASPLRLQTRYKLVDIMYAHIGL